MAEERKTGFSAEAFAALAPIARFRGVDGSDPCGDGAGGRPVCFPASKRGLQYAEDDPLTVGKRHISGCRAVESGNGEPVWIA